MREIVSPLSGFGSPFGLRRRDTPALGPAASGGTETVITQGGKFYRVHTFLSGGDLTVTQGGDVEYLVVAGGGGGGDPGNGCAGGGGAGGLLQGQTIVTSGVKCVTVGDGGSSEGNGENSIFDSIEAIGGGAGGSRNILDVASGGSGGGAGLGNTGARLGGSGTPGQGNDGGSSLDGRGGGGGGAGFPGQNADANDGQGGDGVSVNISGSAVTYAVGGDGGRSSTPSVSGALNRGNGGTRTGAGGSGIVIIRYEITEAE